MSADTCRYCDCQEFAPCEGGCAWANEDRTICSSCQAAVDIASELVKILGAVATNPKAGIRLATAKWELLPLAQQRLLVMTTRATVEGIREALLEGLGTDAVAAGVELNVIGDFLLERCPDQVGEEDSVSAVVLRLLDPHVGSRIVLPDGARA